MKFKPTSIERLRKPTRSRIRMVGDPSVGLSLKPWKQQTILLYEHMMRVQRGEYVPPPKTGLWYYV